MDTFKRLRRLNTPYACRFGEYQYDEVPVEVLGGPVVTSDLGIPLLEHCTRLCDVTFEMIPWRVHVDCTVKFGKIVC